MIQKHFFKLAWPIDARCVHQKMGPAVAIFWQSNLGHRPHSIRRVAYTHWPIFMKLGIQSEEMCLHSHARVHRRTLSFTEVIRFESFDSTNSVNYWEKKNVRGDGDYFIIRLSHTKIWMFYVQNWWRHRTKYDTKSQDFRSTFTRVRAWLIQVARLFLGLESNRCQKRNQTALEGAKMTKCRENYHKT